MFQDRRVVRPLAVVVTGWMVLAMSAASGHLQGASPQGVPASSTTPPPSSSWRAVLDRYCVACHNQRLRTGDLTLDTVDLRNVSEGAEVWEKVLRKLRMGAMPPPGRPRPDQPTYEALVKWLENEIDRAAAIMPNPGRTETFHRLNRAEYQNAIRDLLALETDVASLLPADDADRHGFDNIGGALSVSPLLLERYLSAARTLSRLAVGLAPRGPVVDTYRISPSLVQDDQLSQDLPFGSRGGVAIHHQFPVDGEYEVKVTLQKIANGDYIRGLGEPHHLDVRLDGVRVARFTVGGDATGKPAPVSFGGNISGDPEWELYMHNADAGLAVRFAARAGPRVVGVSFERRPKEPEGVLLPRPTSVAVSQDEAPESNPGVESVAIGGPYNAAAPGGTPSRRKIFVCRPADTAYEEPCARKILSTLARRAYRRPVTEADVEMLLRFYRVGRSEGSFDAGIQFAIESILVDPDFLFRIEADPPNVAPGTPYRLSDLELASRLSFFLWSSIPDDELLDLAVRGKLSEPAVLEQQVQRLLADARSKALVDNFAGQWLELRNLRNAVRDRDLFPEFDENLREAFQRETELFIESQLREDRSVVELLDANYTFVNERLARHYQIPNIHGNRFRRVTFSSREQRGGLLGHGSLLTVTSYPTRTSPVLRGKWLLDNILGLPPSPPPPDVPGLKDEGATGRPASVRERLEAHRKNPVCAMCHAPMDPLGFALEHFDAIGAWRTTSEAGTPIDASWAMPGGAPFHGSADLRTFLVSHHEQFVRALTEKLLAYALGRAVQSSDLPTVRTIVQEAAARDYRWSSLILSIVKSTPFRMRRSRSEDLPESAASVASRR